MSSTFREAFAHLGRRRSQKIRIISGIRIQQTKLDDKNNMHDKSQTVFCEKKIPIILVKRLASRQHLLLRHPGVRRGEGASAGVWGRLLLLTVLGQHRLLFVQ